MAELSPTWQDVFQHKTAVDSLLVGMIAQLTYILSRNPQQNVLPNLLAINPATAFECISKVYSDDGGLNSDSLLLMSLIAKRCATQPHVVAGIDVSGMIDTESPELVTLPHAGRYH